MADALEHKINSQSKFNHVLERIQGLSDNYFPESTKVSWVSFDERAMSYDLGDVRSGALQKFKADVASIKTGGGTNFVRPLRLARNLLQHDLDERTGQGDLAPRSIVFFLTDGRDSMDRNSAGEDRASVMMRQIRDLNATTFVVGTGEDYSMSRIIGLAGQAGASSWSHLPMEEKLLDIFDRQIPDMVEQVMHCEHYFQIEAEGSYRTLAAVSPSIRFAPQGQQLIFPGYVREAAGMLYEQKDNLSLTLRAGRWANDRDGFTQEIPIVDLADAVGLFERQEQARDFNQRLLVLQALMDRDIKVLREIAGIDTRIAPQIEKLIEEIENAGGEDVDQGTQGLHASMSSMGHTGYFSRPPMDQGLINTLANPGGNTLPGSRGNAPEDSAGLYSGHLGPLDMSAPMGALPVPRKLDPKVYDGLAPQVSSHPSLVITGVLNTTISLSGIDTGTAYILGRSEHQTGGNAVVIPVPAVSRSQCKIWHDGSQYLIQDLNSRNGTVANGGKVPSDEPIRLNPGDRIVLPGNVEMIFTVPEQ